MTATKRASAPGAIPNDAPADAAVEVPGDPSDGPTVGPPVDAPESLALAHRLLDVLADRQAEDVVLLDLTTLTAFTDYFVIASGTSDRQLRSLVDAVMRAVPGLGRAEQEGDAAGGWVLLDCGGVVVHLFSAERRTYYDLEGLWSRAQEVVRIQ